MRGPGYLHKDSEAQRGWVHSVNSRKTSGAGCGEGVGALPGELERWAETGARGFIQRMMGAHAKGRACDHPRGLQSAREGSEWPGAMELGERRWWAERSHVTLFPST